MTSGDVAKALNSLLAKRLDVYRHLTTNAR
jgi:hypothetical protein